MTLKDFQLKQWNKPSLIPSAKDIKKLKEFLIEESYQTEKE